MALPFNPLKQRKGDGSVAPPPPPSIAGTRWLFGGSDTTVEFLADGQGAVRHDRRRPALDPQWKTLGQWKQNGESVVFDCNGFTRWEVTLNGDQMKGLVKRSDQPRPAPTDLARLKDMSIFILPSTPLRANPRKLRQTILT